MFEALVRIMDKSKQNHSMYSLQLRRSGQVSIHLSKLEVSRVQNTETLTQVERQLASVNTDISFEKSQFQGFWIAVRNGIDISIGRIGDKIINPVANYSDVIREGRIETVETVLPSVSWPLTFPAQVPRTRTTSG